MTLSNIKEHNYYFRIILLYAFILGIVYGYWLYVSLHIIWAALLVGFGILAIGVIGAFVYVHIASKSIDKPTNDNIEENI